MRNMDFAGPCLVAYRPGVGIASVAVQSIEDVARYVEAWGRFMPAGVQWWVEPDTLPVFAGTSVMDAEQAAARAS